MPTNTKFSRPLCLNRPTAPLVMALSLITGLAHGAENGIPDNAFTFGGFGSVGAVHSNNRQADFTSNILKPNGAGYTHSISTDVDTRLGVQMGLALNRQWSGVLQVITEQRFDNTYTPIIEWANIKYQVTPDLALRFGRIALPIFLAADYRKVGYAYPWVRPPVELYGSVPISNSDGVDLTYRWNANAVKNVTQVFYGGTDVKVTNDVRARARKLAGISNTMEYGATSARVSVLTTDLTVNAARPLFDAFRQFGASGAGIAERYDLEHKRTTAISLGLNYDPGNWFIMGEIGRFNTHSFLGDKLSLYSSAGYRHGAFTPYLAYSHVKSLGATNDPGLNLAALPPQIAPTAAFLNKSLNDILGTIAVQTTLTAGMRWDFMTNVALKVQYDHVLPQNGSHGMLVNPQPGFRSGQAVNVVSAVLDFVF